MITKRKRSSDTSADDTGPIKKRRNNNTQPKFYAVRKGRVPGVYSTWTDCQGQIVGYKGAVFKSFPSLSDAQAFVEGHNPQSYPPKNETPKFYAVARGLQTGIFTDWDETSAAIKGSVKPRYKKFPTRAEAVDFIREFGSPEALKAIENEPLVDAVDPKVTIRNSTITPSDVVKPRVILKNSATAAAAQESETSGSANLLGSAEVDEAYKDFVHVYTDGSSRGNGRVGAAAGVGVFFGYNDPKNVSERLAGEPQTNQRAELTAILFALQRVPHNQKILIITDSQYSIKCATVWAAGWKRKNWMTAGGEEVKNQDLVKSIIHEISLREQAGGLTSFKWVKGHSDSPGNQAADRLAVNGSNMPKVAC
ncbi:Ribonuclease H [Ceratocystis fimbriata CBS 114723]|uniref:Ribonuclease H n=1 Tax=Ceratocystis fimbriata CBS 114723 TaxID=1035309 RepID=A0A2C5XGE7_9PEZI|nr:Ribonuclease H [Ceratocystis fimbriata CBS 114723]